MSTYFLVTFNVPATNSSGESILMPPNVQPGDRVASAIVLAGSQNIGTDITSSFSSPVVAVPSIPGFAGGNYLPMQGDAGQTGLTILALMSRG